MSPARSAAWTAIAADATQAGLEAERIDSDEFVKFQISVDRPDGQDAGAALNSLLNATGLNSSPGISAPFQGSFEQQGAPVGGSNFVLNLTIDGPMLVEALSFPDLPAGSVANDGEDIGLSYTAKMPGSLQETTGREIAEGVIFWQIDRTGITEADAESSAGDTSTVALFIVAGIASVLGVVILAASIGWLLARKPALASNIGQASRHFPRRTTITREGLWIAYRTRTLVDRIWNRAADNQKPPIQDDLLKEPEEEEDGVDTKGDRPSAGVHGG